MVNVFSKNWNTIGNLAIALLFVGSCIFLLTGSWDASESEAAKGCCGGDTTVSSCGGGKTLVAETTVGGCGSANQLSGSNDNDDYKCDCLDPGNEDAECGCTLDDNCGGDSTP